MLEVGFASFFFFIRREGKKKKDQFENQDGGAEGTGEMSDKESNELAAGIAVHVANIQPYESTFQAFKRLTFQQPWVPFAKPESARQMEIEEEEYG